MRRLIDFCSFTGSGWRFLVLIPVMLFFALSWQKSYTGDEGLTVLLASGSYSDLLSNVGADFHVPGYYTCLWLISHFLGGSLLVLRLFSLLLILMMITLALRHLSFTAALFIALSPFTLHLALEIRMYAMLALLGLLLVLAYKRYARLKNRVTLAVLIITLSICTWVHYFGWIGTAAVASLLLVRRKWKHSILVAFSVTVLFLPWAGNIKYKTDSTVNESTVAMEIAADAPALRHRLTGMPLSVGGTILRFAGGTSVFNFSQGGIRSISVMTLLGFSTGLLMLLLAARGFRKSDGICKSLILCAFLGLSFFRPSSRHFAIAFPAYLIAASAGLPSTVFRRNAIITFLAVLMLILCIPLTLRSTLPQRCTWDRDYLQIARLSVEESRRDYLPVVLFLDTYSYLGIKMHMDQLGFPDSMVWHPHRSSFQEGRFFYESIDQCVNYLQHNTDSLVSVWINLTQDRRGFVLIANRPGVTPGRIFGEGDNLFTGLGSDIMADMDLMEALVQAAPVRQINLSGSGGPISLFVCGRNTGQQH
ncbi:MAG: hypothetical protein KAT09_00640 [Candidatus Aegiribacteria sp.]|nr:hypothetical protein [Candidatus Aegiribacteria sp.]